MGVREQHFVIGNDLTVFINQEKYVISDGKRRNKINAGNPTKF